MLAGIAFIIWVLIMIFFMAVLFKTAGVIAGVLAVVIVLFGMHEK